MGRAVRPVDDAGIGRLTDRELDAYIADTERRVSVMTKATLRNDYRKQLRIAQLIKQERGGCTTA